MSGEMKGISAELITSLMANGRSRNSYGPKLMEFYNSDEPAINVAEVWPLEFAQKEASALYQGFLTAAKKAGIQDNLIIKRSEDNVFILHKERVAGLLNPSEDSNSDEVEVEAEVA